MAIEEMTPLAQIGVASVWVWLAAALIVLLGVLVLFVFFETRRRHAGAPLLDDDGKRIRLPLTLLQIRAVWGLVIGSVTLALLAGIVITQGAEEYYRDDSIRSTVYLVALAGAALYLIVHAVSGRRSGNPEKDERDIAVLHWAPTVQVLGMTLTLGAWAIGLTERYWSAGSVPIAYPVLIFLSTLILGGLFQALGILIGYRRF